MKTLKEAFAYVKFPVMYCPSYEELDWLHNSAQYVNSPSILEIGTGPGSSTLALTTACPNSHIDTYDISQLLNGVGPEETGYFINRYCENKDKIHFHYDIVGDPPPNAPYNFIFIDADHIHPAALLDTILALQYAGDKPWIAYHDVDYEQYYNSPYGDGAKRAFNAIAKAGIPGMDSSIMTMRAVQINNSHPYTTMRNMLLDYSYEGLLPFVKSSQMWRENQHKIWEGWAENNKELLERCNLNI